MLLCTECSWFCVKNWLFIAPLTFNTVEIKLDKLAVLQSNKKWEILQSRDLSWMCSLCAEYHVLTRTGVNVSLICWHPDCKLFLWLMCWLNINIREERLTVSIKVDCVCCHWCSNSCLVWVKSWRRGRVMEESVAAAWTATGPLAHICSFILDCSVMFTGILIYFNPAVMGVSQLLQGLQFMIWNVRKLLGLESLKVIDVMLTWWSGSHLIKCSKGIAPDVLVISRLILAWLGL